MRLFLSGYLERELARFDRGEPSVPLEEELRPVAGFLRSQFGFSAKLWEVLHAYGSEVSYVRSAYGGEAGEQAETPSRWEVFRLLVSEAEKSAFERMVECLQKDG